LSSAAEITSDRIDNSVFVGFPPRDQLISCLTNTAWRINGQPTLEIDVGWPIPFHMRNYSLASIMMGGVISDTDPGIGGIQIAEFGWKRR
jgi:hypothetical protein